MVATEIVSMQQVIITVVFLSCLVGLLVFLRMKGGFIRANLQKGQRIKVVEETAVSPTERLRLISIDNRDFVMLSGKNIQPCLVPLAAASGAPQQVVSSVSAAPAFSEHYQQASADEEAPLELTTPAAPPPARPSAQPQQMGPQDVAAFAAKFKGWRKN